MTTNKLPPLPERQTEVSIVRGLERKFPGWAEAGGDYYTADQMHAYALEALRQSQSLPAVAVADIYEAYKMWPEDIRQKLSLHDLRRMNGWAPATNVGDWRIDTSAGGPILVYQDCSVIESEQARYVLRLIGRDQCAALQADAREKGEACRDCDGSGWDEDGGRAVPCATCKGFATQTAQASEVVRGEATGDTTTFKDAWARLSPIDRSVISIYFQETHPQPVTPAGDVPFSTVREVVKALTRLGTSTPESQEEQAARAVELIGWLCREVHSHFDELSKVTPAGGEVEPVAWCVTSDDSTITCYAEATAQAQAFELRRGGYPATITPLYTHPPVADAALVDMERECWSLICDSTPTQAGDADMEWSVVSYHMDAPYERTVATGNTPAKALAAAVAALNQRGGGRG